MAPMLGQLRLRLRDQAGFTLIEMLVAMGIALIVGAAALALLDSASPLASKEIQRGAVVGEGRAGLESIVRTIRNADTVNATSSYTIDINVPTSAGKRRVLLDCTSFAAGSTYRQCVQYTAAVGQEITTAGRVVVARIVNGTGSSSAEPVFSYSPDRVRPTVVRMKLIIPSSDGTSPGYSHRVVLSDAAYLRNLDLTGA